MKKGIHQRVAMVIVGLALLWLGALPIEAGPLVQIGVSPLDTPAAPTAMPVPAAIVLTHVEPRVLLNTSGGTLSVYGRGFSAQCVVRLVGYGLLPTTFVNETALSAQIPPGVFAGVYTVEVSNSTAAVQLENALSILAPTPTPASTSVPEPPPPGRPILTVRSYSVEPSRVRAGQEFVVTITIYNNGSRAGENTMAVFPGTTFVPVGEPGHLLWQLPINHTAVVSQKLRAPSSLGSGVHQVQVNLSANDFEGSHYDYPQTVPVEVIGSAPVSGQPKVTIEDSSTDPAVLVPGAPFTLTLRLANRGSRTARNVFAQCTSALAIPMAQGDAVSTAQIGIDAVTTVTLPLLLDVAAPGGRQRLDIALSCEDFSGGAYSGEETVGVEVSAGLTFQPQVLIGRYRSTPDAIRPGDAFTLSVDLVNVGGGDAERLVLALGGENGAALELFSPLLAGNVIFVERLTAGETTTVAWRLLADGGAGARAYNLPLALAYDDPRGGRHSDTQRLSLMVRHQPEMQAIFYRKPEGLQIGAPAAISLEVLNVGSGAVNITHLGAASADMDVAVEGTPFMGTVEAGSSAPLDVTVTPHKSGAASITVLITYRDDFNQSQLLTTTLTVDVTGDAGHSSPVPASPSTGQLEKRETGITVWQRAWQLVKGFLGFGS